MDSPRSPRQLAAHARQTNSTARPNETRRRCILNRNGSGEFFESHRLGEHLPFLGCRFSVELLLIKSRDAKGQWPILEGIGHWYLFSEVFQSALARQGS